MNPGRAPAAPSGTARPAVAGLLLAAGSGSRMGLPKALVAWEGGLLVERGVALLTAGGCDPVVVVLGASADQVLVSANLAPAEAIVHHGWNEGMGSSLRAGLIALEKGDARCDAAVVALVDQPLVTSEAVRRLIETWAARSPRPAAAVATYAGQPRNPVLLDREAWDPAMTSARGDTGARSFLRTGLSDGRVVPVPCDDVGTPDDIDTPEQLAHVVHATVEEG